ncbi:serine/threonine-protein kinase SBK1-like, partial [Arapaima gigas]
GLYNLFLFCSVTLHLKSYFITSNGSNEKFQELQHIHENSLQFIGRDVVYALAYVNCSSLCMWGGGGCYTKLLLTL